MTISQQQERIRVPSQEEVKAAFQKLRKSLADFQQKAIVERRIGTLEYLDHLRAIEEFATEMERFTDIHERALTQAVQLNIVLLQRLRRAGGDGVR